MNATPAGILREIEDITGFLMEKGLIDDQTWPYRHDGPDNTVEIRYPSALSGATVLRDRPYSITYNELLTARSFNFRMLDGALIQMGYTFTGPDLAAGRLAFLPSPDLSEYQNDPELYDSDPIFADMLDRRVVTVPVRFDFDTREGVMADVIHPASHLTLGQYMNCRIAATAALTPGLFVEFILRSFYNTASRMHSEGLPMRGHRFDSTITDAERLLVHVGVP
ncbi:hypothetical protein DSM43518_05627 [Mycobacterium marinum]|uniref:DUF2290 domain-containing protein n=1 Tax=Mycobacterium marinum TaxID=1781 RepID=UPI000E3DB2A9|nr:DUF2290 domain-containing protein [Mycobacterium marinum]RFZ01134.1 hypothetical protein DSM43518_05627 [Mycobacterium marinum]